MSSNILSQHEALVSKGKELYAQMAREIHQRGDRVQPLPTIAPNYILTLDPPSEISIDAGMIRAIEDAGLPTNDYVFALASNPGNQQHPYQSYVHIHGRAILCTCNYSDRDLFWKQPGQIFWTDLMAVTFHRVTTAYGGDTKGLETIWRLSIDNDAVVDLQAGDDGFFALLGTDHGKGLARMLADYPEMFGRRIIASAGGGRANPDATRGTDRTPSVEERDTKA
ncbi:hypothetical protein EDB80DRAFT_678730 [Ilyonectria destructans]|nr:hypothetical protein EDB80DRAFT_678730 [Ilyonectria destructans]